MHFHNAPSGGLSPQVGHEKSSRRGSFAIRESARACFNPPQQFKSINTDTTAIQVEWIHTASAIKPAIPIKPKIVVTVRLRARPIINHSRERRIWPPSNG